MENNVFEILTWRSAENVSNESMINSLNRFSESVGKLPGFLYQSLYQKESGAWVCIYFWESEEQAHQSNELVSEWPVFKELMSLIEQDSITMEVLSPVQSQGNLSFR
jgi:hypothetical protein